MKRLYYLLICIVILAVYGTFNSCNKEKTPSASFSYSPTDIYTGTTVSFHNESKDATSYNWSFGDGDISSSENPTHSYEYAGYYTVELVAFSSSGNKTNSTSKEIYVTEKTPTASFSVSTSYPDTYETVYFTNNSSNASTYYWDFGDGSSSTLKNPSHYYTSSGSKTVKLTAYSASGNKSHSTTKTLSVSSSSNYGDVMFWTDETTTYNITVTFRGIDKTITGYYYSTPSSCGASGCATYWSVPEGTYWFTAENLLYEWSGYVTVYDGVCSKMLLYHSKAKKQSHPENQSTDKLILCEEEY